MLALILLYQTHALERCDSAGQFLSYARLVRCLHESAGQKLGAGGQKIGNAHLRWAVAEAACLFLRSRERAKTWKQRQAAQRGEGKALAILAARRGRAVYPMLRKGEAFDAERFGQGRTPTSRTGSSSLSQKESAPVGDCLPGRPGPGPLGRGAGAGRLRAVPALAGPGAGSVPGAWRARAAAPVVCGPPGAGRVAWFPLRRRRQRAGPVGGGDAPAAACGRDRLVRAPGACAAVAAAAGGGKAPR